MYIYWATPCSHGAELYGHLLDLLPETEEAVNEERHQQLRVKLKEFLHGSSAPPDLMRADLLLCTRPFLFCWLLRPLWPPHLPALPMLHCYSGPLLFDTTLSDAAGSACLSADREGVSSGPGRFLLGVAERLDAGDGRHGRAPCPTARNPAPGPLLAASRGTRRRCVARRALVLRSTWVGSLMGDAFGTVLADLLSANGLRGAMELDWLTLGSSWTTQTSPASTLQCFFQSSPTSSRSGSSTRWHA
jgi:hypothetical protein